MRHPANLTTRACISPAVFTYYAVTASCESLISCLLLNALKVKHLRTYMMRNFTGSTIRLIRVKFIHALLFRKSTQRLDISYLTCLLHVPHNIKGDVRPFYTFDDKNVNIF